jgi:hypothetical protein
MNANHELERRLADFYATEAPQRAPDRVLEAVLETSEITRQRRALIRLPWRFPIMNNVAKVAIAAVAVIAIGAVGLAVLRPGTSPGVGGPALTPSPESSPSSSLPATSQPASSPGLAPPLTQNFTSTLHGISMSYPEGWTTQAATTPWTDEALNFQVPSGDFLYDPTLRDHLFLVIASQPIGDATPDEWTGANFEACGATEPITVDGASGLIGAEECNEVAVTTDGRGYIVRLYTSGDEAWLSTTFDRAWFEEVLATVQLQPVDAVDVAPSASP